MELWCFNVFLYSGCFWSVISSTFMLMLIFVSSTDAGFDIFCLEKVSSFYNNDHEPMVHFYKFVATYVVVSMISILYKGPEMPCLRIIGKCININTTVTIKTSQGRLSHTSTSV